MDSLFHAVPLYKLRDRLAELDRIQAEAAIERRMLENLIREAVPVEAGEEENQPGHLTLTDPDRLHPDNVTRLGPREAIVEFVRHNPGFTATQIAEQLMDKVDSSAKDKRNVLRTTVAVLWKSGVLDRGPDGGHHIGKVRP